MDPQRRGAVRPSEEHAALWHRAMIRSGSPSDVAATSGRACPSRDSAADGVRSVSPSSIVGSPAGSASDSGTTSTLVEPIPRKSATASRTGAIASVARDEHRDDGGRDRQPASRERCRTEPCASGDRRGRVAVAVAGSVSRCSPTLARTCARRASDHGSIIAHRPRRWVPSWTSWARNRDIARDRRDLTVPLAHPSTSAISFSDSCSK